MRLSRLSGLCIILFALLFQACTKKTVVEPPEAEETRTLVLLSDFSAGSDVVVRITGRVRGTYSNVWVEYVPARAFSIKESAYLLEVAAQSYPEGTYFAGMVEPGGTSPRMVFEAEGKKRFLVPNNGLATRVLHYMETKDFYKVENPNVLGESAPEDLSYEEFYTEAILSLLADEPLSDFGSALADPVTWEVQEPVQDGNAIRGEILFSDNFGNCVTNIPDSLLTGLSQGDLLRVSTETDSFLMILGTAYSSVPVGQNVAFVNSSHRLELAVNYGNLSERYSIGAGTETSLTQGMARIGLLCYNETSTVLTLVSGMKSQLSELGFSEGINTVYYERSASGNADNLPELVSEVVDLGIDIMVSVSTPTSQAAVLGTPEDIPIVFTYVTDPSSAGLFDHRKHVTGLSGRINYDQYLGFVKNLFPLMAVAGRIYNTDEANSVYAHQQLSALAPFYGIQFISATVASVEDVVNAYQQIKDQGIEAMLILDDNTMSAAMSSLIALSLPDSIPIIGKAVEDVQKGALASISVNYDDMAKSAGDLAAAVLLGIEPDDVPVQLFNTDVIAINTDTASKIGYTFPAEVLAEARFVLPATTISKLGWESVCELIRKDFTRRFISR